MREFSWKVARRPDDPSSQIQLHERGVREGALAVGRDRPESQGNVQGDGASHLGGDGVQPDAIVAEIPSLLDDPLREPAAQFESPVPGPDVEALHLADAVSLY